MKKVIILLLAVCFVFCGCNKSCSNPKLNSISFNALIKCDKSNFKADVSIDEKGIIYAIVTEPERIKKLSFTVNDNEITTEYMGLSMTAGKSEISSCFSLLKKVFNDIKDKRLSSNNSNPIIKDEVNGVNYKFTFSPDGLPLNIEFDDYNIRIVFSNIKTSP